MTRKGPVRDEEVKAAALISKKDIEIFFGEREVDT